MGLGLTSLEHGISICKIHGYLWRRCVVGRLDSPSGESAEDIPVGAVLLAAEDILGDAGTLCTTTGTDQRGEIPGIQLTDFVKLTM